MRGVMFLRHTKRKKDGKEHRYWSIVENRRVGAGRVVQRPLLYLGEINDSQELAWRKSIAVFEEGAAAPAAAVGRVLVGAESVARTGARPVLGRAARPEPQGDTLAPGAAAVGNLPAAGAGERVAPASPMVRAQRDGRLVGGGCRAGGDRQALPLSRSVARTQASAIRPS